MPRRAHKNKKYSNEFRKKAVEAYLRGEGSLVTLSKRFGLFIKKHSESGFYGIMVVESIKSAVAPKEKSI